MADHAHAHAAHDHMPRGITRWLYSTNHKDIGTMYIAYAVVFGIVGAVLSIFMRMELAEPGMQIFADSHTFNVFVTGHGLIMVFFMIMPAFIGGFGNWFVPLMIGAPDMAFPRMNNISFWLLVPSGALLVTSMFRGWGAWTGRWCGAGRSMRRYRPRAMLARPWTSASSRCISRARRQFSAPSTSSPRF